MGKTTTQRPLSACCDRSSKMTHMSQARKNDPSSLESATALFLASRSKLFGVAYRMLGTVAEAEDIVQETWLRWQAADRTVVVEPVAYLVAVATRISINVAQSAHSRRQTYVGPWLPEPVDTTSDPMLGAERGEALELAVMLLLEKLPANERAAYVLREAFDYSHREIAEVLGITESNTRQIVTRARRHIADSRRSPSGQAEHVRLLRAFLEAAQRGELDVLERLLSADAISYSDGGGVARAALVPICGRARVAKFVASFASHFWTGATITWVDANGAPGALLSRDGRPYALVAIDAANAEIDRVLWILNPEKLVSISAK
jgi:RNA polymerase sigma-70 factor (ECF subfamily)